MAKPISKAISKPDLKMLSGITNNEASGFSSCDGYCFVKKNQVDWIVPGTDKVVYFDLWSILELTMLTLGWTSSQIEDFHQNEFNKIFEDNPLEACLLTTFKRQALLKAINSGKYGRGFGVMSHMANQSAGNLVFNTFGAVDKEFERVSPILHLVELSSRDVIRRLSFVNEDGETERVGGGYFVLSNLPGLSKIGEIKIRDKGFTLIRPRKDRPQLKFGFDSPQAETQPAVVEKEADVSTKSFVIHVDAVGDEEIEIHDPKSGRKLKIDLSNGDWGAMVDEQDKLFDFIRSSLTKFQEGRSGSVTPVSGSNIQRR